MYWASHKSVLNCILHTTHVLYKLLAGKVAYPKKVPVNFFTVYCRVYANAQVLFEPVKFAFQDGKTHTIVDCISNSETLKESSISPLSKVTCQSAVLFVPHAWLLGSTEFGETSRKA